MKKSKGITLIGLVVTIIVILILSAVSVRLVSGSKGLVSKSSKATRITILEQEREQIVLVYNTVFINYYTVGGVPFKEFAREFDRIYYSSKAERVEGVNSIPSGGNKVSVLEKVEKFLIPTAYATTSEADGNYDTNSYYDTQFNYAKITYNTDDIFYLALRYADENKPGEIISDPNNPDPNDDSPSDNDPADDNPEEDGEDDDVNEIFQAPVNEADFELSAYSDSENSKTYIKASYLNDYADFAKRSLVGKTIAQKTTIFMASDKYLNNENLSEAAKNTTNFQTYVEEVYDFDFSEMSEGTDPFIYFFQQYHYANTQSEIDERLITDQRVFIQEYNEKYNQEYIVTCEPKTVNVTFSPQVIKDDWGEDPDDPYMSMWLGTAKFQVTQSDDYTIKVYAKDDYQENGQNATLLDQKKVRVRIYSPTVQDFTGEDENDDNENTNYNKLFTYEYVGAKENYNYIGTRSYTDYSFLKKYNRQGFAITGFSQAGIEYYNQRANSIVELPSEITVDGETLPIVAIAENAFQGQETWYEGQVDYSKIAKIKVPSSVKSLHSNSLGCVSDNLVEVELVEGLQNLEANVFGQGTSDYEDIYADYQPMYIRLPSTLRFIQKQNTAYINNIFSISPQNIRSIDLENGATQSNLKITQELVIFRGTLQELNSATAIKGSLLDSSRYADGSAVYCLSDEKLAVPQDYTNPNGQWIEPNDMVSYYTNAQSTAAWGHQDPQDLVDALQVKLTRALQKLGQ